MKNKKKGFTLVELLVVIAILAVLASVSVVGYLGFKAKADHSKAVAELKQAQTTIIAACAGDNTEEKNGYTINFDGKTLTIVTTNTDKTLETAYNKVFDTEQDLPGTLNLETNGTVTYTVNGQTAVWTLANGEVK